VHTSCVTSGPMRTLRTPLQVQRVPFHGPERAAVAGGVKLRIRPDAGLLHAWTQPVVLLGECRLVDVLASVGLAVMVPSICSKAWLRSAS